MSKPSERMQYDARLHNLKQLRKMSKQGIEIWKDIPDFPQYQISTLGRVWSKSRVIYGKTRLGDSRPYKRQGKFMALCLKNGYPSTVLYDGKSNYKNYDVHILMMITFVGPRSADRPEVRHLDDNRSHNILYNLRYGMRKHNVADAIKNGHFGRGNRAGGAILTFQDVKAIRRKLKRGEKGILIAKEFGVAPQTISSLKHGRSWGWTL